MRQAPPSFTTAAWSDPRPASGGVRVVLPVDQYGGFDADTTEARLRNLIADLASCLGVPPTMSSGVSAVPESGNGKQVVVIVDDVVRLVVPVALHAEARHQTGWACDLGGLEAVAVASVERVLLDDPGTLFDDSAVGDWLTSLAPAPNLPLDPVSVRTLLSRHVPLIDGDAVGQAVAFAEDFDEDVRLSGLTALLSSVELAIEVPRDTSEQAGAAAQGWVETTAQEASLSVGLGALSLPTVRHSDASVLTGGSEGPRRMRVLLGGIPLVTMNLGEGNDLDRMWLLQQLRRAAAQTWNQVTTAWRLDVLAQTFPDAVAALRLRLSDALVAEVLRELSAELIVQDLPLVVDLLVEPIEPRVGPLVEHVRPHLVERQLYAWAGRQSLPLFTVAADTEAALAAPRRAASSSPHRPRQLTHVEDVLRMVDLALPAASWHAHPVAVIVDNPAARRPLRRLLRTQAPDLLVLQAAELPRWVDTHDMGELALTAT